ncbi:hypothetical protein D3C87_1318310 [compost metagenome]
MITALLTLLSLSFAQTFERPCFVAGEDDMLTSKIQITDSHWTVTHTAYVDEACKETYLVFETTSKVKVEAQKIDQKIDMTTLEVSYVSTRDDVTRALNEINFCGKQDWATNHRQIVTGLQCQDFAAPALGQVVYSIFQVKEQNGQTEARIGEASPAGDGSTADKRHAQLEMQPYYLTP